MGQGGSTFPAVMSGLGELTKGAASIVAAARGGGSCQCNDTAEPRKEVVQNPALVGILTEYQKKNDELLAQFNVISQNIKSQGLESKIETFADLERFDEASAAALVELAKRTAPITLNGRNFGFFGITSTGKSTIINKLIGRDVAEVGAGETTTHIEKYEGRNFKLFDIPGRNDEMNYFTMEYIGFWKGLTNRLFVITATLKEMTKVLGLLDAINLPYDIVVNKFDFVPSQERDTLKEKIRKEVQTLRLKGVRHIWFVSAKYPEQFPDWNDMANSMN